MGYKRVCRKVCIGMLLLALTIRMVLATGVDQRAHTYLANMAGDESFISWMLYLEMGQVYSPQEALERTQQTLAVNAEQREPEPADAEEGKESLFVQVTPVEPEEEPMTGENTPLEAEDPELEEGGEEADTEANEIEEDTAEENITQESKEEIPSMQESVESVTQAEPEQEPASTQAPEPLTFTEQEAQAITIGGACTYTVDKTALLQKQLDLDFSGTEPTVLIVHTHSSEAYTQETGWEYEESDELRTQNPERSVIRVGEELAQVLRDHGISVIHDTSINDYPSYNGAYDRTLEKINQWVAQYPSIQMVLDVHRDAQEDEDGTPLGSVVEVDGQESSQIMLVVGTDEGGLEHPNWQENLAAALQVQALANRDYPELMRNLDLRTERFNQHMTKGSLLLEMGSTGNTLKQALVAARAIGECLAQLIGQYS